MQQIATLKNLPTLPHILLKLIDACNQDRGSLKEVSKIVEKDPSLTSKILRLVNSAYYGLPHRVEDISQAVTLTGTNAIKNIAICSSVYEAFNQNKGKGTFNLKAFWWHSLKCAVLARLIAKKTRYNHPDETFLSGLLHDIGKLVLLVNFPEQYEDLLESCKDRPDLLLGGERRLGATHWEVGAWFIHRWNLQSFMADSVLYHHESKSRILDALPLVQIVYVANTLCQKPTQGKEKPFKIAEEVFGFSGPDVEEFISRSDKEAKEVAQSLDIEIEPPKESEGLLSEKDLKKQEDLICEVRDFSLLLGTLQNLLGADDQDGILKAVRQGFQILFDVKDVLFFLHDPDKGVLIGKNISEDKRFSVIEGLIIPLQMEKSLLIKSLRQGKRLDSFGPSNDSVPIILDEQIIRIVGKEGIVCLPMVAGGEHVGVILIGCGQAESYHLLKDSRLLTMFTNQAAMALHVDHLRRSRAKIIQSERLRASSGAVQKVLHEVNNPLGIIKNYLKILGTKLSDQNIAQDEIKIINEEIDRVADTLRKLAAFSEDRIRKNKPVAINALVSDLTKITRESLFKDSKVDLHLDLDPSLPTVMAEKNGLKQVFINLINNAVEAMTGGGNLHIRTRCISSPLDMHLAGHREEYHRYIEITISDDGIGIPDEIKSRLFEPFVSSKGGDHSGLGLSIVHSIIDALNGTIMCESSKNKGTTFKIELPTVSNRKT